MFKQKGQATVEYLLIFIVLALITLASFSTLYPRVKDTAENLFTEARERIVK